MVPVLLRRPSRILVGIPLNAFESRDLLEWVVHVLARPGDTVVALHVIAASMSSNKNKNKNKAVITGGRKEGKFGRQYYPSTRKQCQKDVRLAKSFVISITGELVKTCQSNEVNLEARVGMSSSTGRGLVEEAKNMEADYLIVGGGNGSKNNKERYANTNNRSGSSNASSLINNFWNKISRITLKLLLSSRSTPSSSVSKYCCLHVSDGCSLVIVRQPAAKLGLQQNVRAKSTRVQGIAEKSKWSEKTSCTEGEISSSEITKFKKSSPRTVLDICDGDSQSNSDEEDSSNSGEETSSSTNTSLLGSTDQSSKGKPSDHQSKKTVSPFKRIYSILSLSCGWNAAREKKQKQQPLLRCFSYEEIAKATNNFHTENLVGQGGYSEVYKGDLTDGCSIAVKRLAKDNNNANKEKEFLMELGIIGHVNHPNAAKLVGCCIENGLYLIFKFYPNGTLSSALHGDTSKSCLDWPLRYRIALGAARGLHYLHKCCKHRIIHRDIKASNVLLGPDYEPQISDFGLAKWLPSKWTHHALVPIEGTFGYLAPEYFMHGIVDEKTDVFAFGILLLEIITGRRPVDSNRQHLLLWARPLMESGNLRQLVDPKLEGKYDIEQLYRVALTASYCVRQSSIWRPSMTEVLQLLTYGQDSGAARSWRIPKFTSDEMDDYSMIFGYKLPSDLTLDDI